jgi:hypothetical protein
MLLAALVQPGVGIPPFVARIAEFGLAGAAAYLLDDAAAPLTTVTPPRPWRRRAPALVGGGAALAAAWLCVLLVLDQQESRPPVGPASFELLVLTLSAVAAAAVLVRRGDPEPGVLVAPSMVLLGLTAMIGEAVLRTEILLPWDGGVDRGLAPAWVGVGLLASGVLLLAMRDPASGPRGLWARSRREEAGIGGPCP